MFLYDIEGVDSKSSSLPWRIFPGLISVDGFGFYWWTKGLVFPLETRSNELKNELEGASVHCLVNRLDKYVGFYFMGVDLREKILEDILFWQFRLRLSD